jgi:hypothetical protein
VIKIILVAALLVGLSACAPPIRPNANTAECWLLQCFTIPTALRISGSGISRPLFPIHGVLRASVVSLQLVEQWCGLLGAASWRPPSDLMRDCPAYGGRCSCRCGPDDVSRLEKRNDRESQTAVVR